jgi:hypothetical protein
LADRSLAATVLESLLPILRNGDAVVDADEKLDVDKVVSVCRNLQLEQLGILILESVKSNQGKMLYFTIINYDRS